MKKEELWAKYVAKNPQFEGDGNVTLSARGLRKFFEQAYDQGHAQGIGNGRALERRHSTPKSNTDPMDLFDSVFGK